MQVALHRAIQSAELAKIIHVLGLQLLTPLNV